MKPRLCHSRSRSAARVLLACAVTILAVLLHPSVASGGSVLIVTGTIANEDALKAFLESPAAGGHVVTVTTGYKGTLSEAKIAELNAYDLIVMRTSSSDYYSTGVGQADAWNGLTASLIATAAGLVAQNGYRWNWIGRDAGATTSVADGILVAKDVGHPFYAGTTMVDGKVTVYSPGRTITHFPTGVGNAILVGESTASTPRPLLATWVSGQFFRGTSGQIAGGKRVYFPLPGGDVMTDITDDGKRLLANIVASLMPSPAGTVILLR